jgi:hypothetical protein
MTRREEIQKLIDEEMGIDDYGSCDFQVGVCYGVRYADKTLIKKACEYAQSKYDLDYCGNVRDVLNYLKSLMEE